MSQRVYRLFQQSVEAKMQLGEQLAPHIELASDIVVDSLLDEKKIIISGLGRSASIGQMLLASLLDRYEKDRPGLPALWLGDGITEEMWQEEILAKPLRALAQAGDILLVISAKNNNTSLCAAIEVAHERDMTVIALTGQEHNDIRPLLSDRDVEINANLDSLARVHELHLLIVFCLCDLIDYKIFGIE